MTAIRLPTFELFAEGDHDGERWTEGDLDELVANFARLSTGDRPAHEPPLVIGHEDDQQLLDRTDLPSAGVIDSLRKWWDPTEGRWTLLGTARDVDEVPADWIDRKLYRKVSAEIYDHPSQANLPGEGKVLRRVALLGGEVPRVKGLKALPFTRRFSEGGKYRRVTRFSEGKAKMDREQLVQLALQLGVGQKTIDMLSDEQLAALVLDLQAAAAGMAPAGEEPPPEAPAEPAILSETPPEEDPDKPSMNSEAVPAAAPAPAASSGFPSGTPSQMILKYAELERNFKRLDRQMQQRERLEAVRTRQEHAGAVHAFCERMVKAKKLTPAEADPTDPKRINTYHRLLRSSPTKVHKFSEGGRQVVKSETELQMAEIEARDPALLTRFFSEKMQQPQPGGGGMSDARKKELLGSSLLGRAVLSGAKK